MKKIQPFKLYFNTDNYPFDKLSGRIGKYLTGAAKIDIKDFYIEIKPKKANWTTRQRLGFWQFCKDVAAQDLTGKDKDDIAFDLKTRFLELENIYFSSDSALMQVTALEQYVSEIESGQRRGKRYKARGHQSLPDGLYYVPSLTEIQKDEMSELMTQCSEWHETFFGAKYIWEHEKT